MITKINNLSTSLKKILLDAGEDPFENWIYIQNQQIVRDGYPIENQLVRFGTSVYSLIFPMNGLDDKYTSFINRFVKKYSDAQASNIFCPTIILETKVHESLLENFVNSVVLDA